MRESPFPQRGYKKTQPMKAALSDFKKLHIEAEVSDIPILDDIVLPFDTEESFFTDRRIRAAFHQVFVGDDLRTDEASLDITVDLAGGLRCFRSFTDRPRTTFIRSDGEEIDES